MIRLPRLLMPALLCMAGLSMQAYAASPLLEQIQDAFIEIGEQLQPSVVNIQVERAVDGVMGEMNMEDLQKLFRFFGDEEQEEKLQRHMPRPLSEGSGFIYDVEGHIVTNHHVVKDAEKIQVGLWNGDLYDATVVAADPQTDIAVIKIEPEEGSELRPLPLGDSDALRVGQFAIAMGSPQGLVGSLSFGHVTALGRQGDEVLLPQTGIEFYDFIQTDAAINLGNSGGPLCNIDGEAIGINTAIVWRAESLAFAIPINTVKKVVPELITKQKVTRGYLGVGIEDASNFSDVEDLPDKNGAYVTAVVPETPAAEAGLQVYDIVRKVNGETVTTAADLMNKISDYAPGETVVLEVLRDSATLDVDVTLSERPENRRKALLGPDFLGVRVQPLTAELIEAFGLDSATSGVLVASVEPDSASDRAGIRESDIILEVAKKPVANPEEFRDVMRANTIPGKSILMRVTRAESPIPFLITVKVPEEQEPEN